MKRRPLIASVAAVCWMSLVACCAASACKKDEPPRADPASQTSGPAPVVLGPGSKLLIGTWQAEEFIAASPSGSASAKALNAQIASDAAQAVKVTYTQTQVQIVVSGQTLASSYVVREDGVGKCTLLNGKDVVNITFFDDDHMLIDRPGNAFAAKMKMRRLVTDASPVWP